MNRKILTTLFTAVSIMASAQTMSTEKIIISTENADTAYLTVYQPEKPSGVAIVDCPGGGYTHLAMMHEGSDWAPFFNNLGITYAVLKYRMPKGDRNIPMSDAQKAVKLMRSHTKDWHINPNKVGIMGFSAGGHLAATTATLAQDNASPNFQILFYPVISMDQSITHKWSCMNFLGEQGANDSELIKKYSCQNNVTKNTPKALLIWGESDTAVPPTTNVALYIEALKKADISLETMSFPDTGHGFGFRTYGSPDANPEKKNSLSQEDHDHMLAFMTQWLKKL